MQLETALYNQYYFCNTELRTATVTKIKGLLIQTQLNMFVLFTLLKLTLDECKTLTKISTRNLSQQFPQISARFGHDKIRNKKTGKKNHAHCLVAWGASTTIWDHHSWVGLEGYAGVFTAFSLLTLCA